MSRDEKDAQADPPCTNSRNQLNFWTNSVTDREDSIFIFYSDERKVGVKTMRK